MYLTTRLEWLPQVFPMLMEEFCVCYATVTFRRKKLPTPGPMSLHYGLPQDGLCFCAGDFLFLLFLMHNSLHNAYQLASQTCMPTYLKLLLLWVSLSTTSVMTEIHWIKGANSLWLMISLNSCLLLFMFILTVTIFSYI